MGFRRRFHGGGGLTFVDSGTPHPGAIYGLHDNNGLLWYEDLFQNGKNAPDGSTGRAAHSGSQIGQGWQDIATAFSDGDGVIYAIHRDGSFLWYQDELRNGANAADGSTCWAQSSGNPIGQVGALPHFQDPRPAIRELARVLRPGGVLVLESSNKRNLKAIAAYLLRRQEWSPFARGSERDEGVYLLPDVIRPDGSTSLGRPQIFDRGRSGSARQRRSTMLPPTSGHGCARRASLSTRRERCLSFACPPSPGECRRGCSLPLSSPCSRSWIP